MRRVWMLGAAIAVTTLGCGSSGDDGSQGADAKPTIANYAALVHTNYEEALEKVEALRLAINAFVDAPSEAGLEMAKAAWKAARPSYVQSEAFRFYGGPIDDETSGPEARINGWPLDELYIDYGKDQPMAGVINDAVAFPNLTKDIISGLNEVGGEKNLSCGYHAIEFLLWGQDLSTNGPGARPYTDYVTASGGTAVNQGRRGQYLKAVADLLVDDLRFVELAWDPGHQNYAATFLADNSQASLSKMVKAMGSLSGTELANERMNNAYETKDQEEEHSCFSDNTHVDHLNDAIGLQNVYLGRYGSLDGAGLDDLVRAKNPALDMRMTADLAAVIMAIEGIPKPFDQAILDDAGRAKIKTAMDALKQLTATIVEVASTLGLTINLE